jgi:hypothetical protein
MSDYKPLSKGRGVPSVGPDGEFMQNAGKYARNAVLTAFDMIGGVDAMAEWAQENPGEFYTKMFSKTITRDVEKTDTTSVEDILRKLDQGIIDLEPDEFEEVDPEFEEDYPAEDEIYDE